MLARLLVVGGPHYMKKFAEKTGGIVIMQRRLKRWWHRPSMWPICFAVLFGRDVATINMGGDCDLADLLEVFNATTQMQVVYPEIFPVLVTMLQNGLRAITMDQADLNSPPEDRADAHNVIHIRSSQSPSDHNIIESIPMDRGSISSGETNFFLITGTVLIESSYYEFLRRWEGRCNYDCSYGIPFSGRCPQQKPSLSRFCSKL